MQADIGNVTINGGWLVFAALVAVWVALVVESRTRRLSGLLEAAEEEAAEAREKSRLAEKETGANPRAGLGQLAAAVERAEQPSTMAQPELAKYDPPAAQGTQGVEPSITI